MDADSGVILGTLDRRGRIYRWMFDLFHKWDLNTLTLNRSLRDGLIWLFSLLDIVTSASGVWISWQRLINAAFKR